MFSGQRKFTLLGITIFSIILLSGSFSFHDASAATFPVDIKLILTETDIFQEWDIVGGTTALEVVTDNFDAFDDLDAKYVVSMINNE